MVGPTALVVSLLLLACAVEATPTVTLTSRQGITPLTQSQIDAFTPYSFYASTGYCPPAETLAWDCGVNCEGNPGFKPVASGGDGDATPYWYVGYDAALRSAIVSHSGTNTSQALSLLYNVNNTRSPLDPTLFPGLNSNISAHDGYAFVQTLTASAILSAVKDTLSTFDTNAIHVVGHSLGAAVSLLDAVFLFLQIPTATVTFVGYGLPRVGNQAFANYVDAQPISVTHINNMEDPIPIRPPLIQGFVHPSGEVHIEDSGTWVSCPGQDNPSTECSTGDVKSLFSGNLTNHFGPYNGVEMGC